MKPIGLLLFVVFLTMNNGMSHATQPASKQSPLPPNAVTQEAEPALELLSHSGGLGNHINNLTKNKP